MIFFPEGLILKTRLNLTRICLIGLLAAWPVSTSTRAMAGMFGISIPANYGKWFTAIMDLYNQNQQLITNARRMYMSYLKVSKTLDALKDLSAGDKEAFKARWTQNLRVLLETNILFSIDEQLLQGDSSINQILFQITGLTYDEDTDSYAIDPQTISLLAIDVQADESTWRDRFLNNSFPTLPGHLANQDQLVAVTDEFLSNQVESAFWDFSERLQTQVNRDILEEVHGNPLIFLDCSGFDPCWSPFAFGSARQWTWPEMRAMMFDTKHPVHAPGYRESEVSKDPAGGIDSYNQYIHRRLCSSIWLAMGEQLRKKVRSTATSLQNRCADINRAVQDVENLTNLLDTINFGLDTWETDGGGLSAASIIATAFDISAGGRAQEQARNESYVTGLIARKLEKSVERARTVKARAGELQKALDNLLAQMTASQPVTLPIDSGFIDIALSAVAPNQTAQYLIPPGRISKTINLGRFK